jgi:ribosomal protein L9
VLDEAINGVISTKDKEVTIETEDGFMMTFLVNEILKVNDTSNLMDSIKRINRDEIEKEKAIQNREVLSKSEKIRTRELHQNLILHRKTGNKQTRYVNYD